jgi:hypothetical protein
MVRHVTHNSIAPTRSQDKEEKSWGHLNNLALKGNGESSISETRRRAEAVRADAPQDPHNMAKAALLEVVRHITRPVYLPHRGKELGRCFWVIKLTRHRKGMGTRACSKSGEHPKTCKVDRDRKTRVLRQRPNCLNAHPDVGYGNPHRKSSETDVMACGCYGV